MSEMFDGGSTSTWDDWLVMRRPDTGNEFADGVARALLDPNFSLDQDLDLSAQGTRDGLRQLFDEFEADTAGQPVRGRSFAGWKRRAPDAWQVAADPEARAVTLTLGAQGQAGAFVVMAASSAAALARELQRAAEASDS